MTTEAPAITSPSIQPKGWSDLVSIFGFILAISSVLLAIFSGFGTKWGWWDFRSGLKLFMYSSFVGAAGLVFSIIGLSFSPMKGPGFWKPVLGALLSLLITSNFLGRYYVAKQVPAIHDITTDTQNPPAFDDAILTLRNGAMNPPEYGGPSVAELQQKAYGDIQPLVLNKPVTQVWEACLGAAHDLNWEIVLADEPHGRLEATDTTYWFAFKDDVVIRIVDEKGQSRVDVRSVSRVGKGDVGANAKRIREFLKRLKRAS